MEMTNDESLNVTLSPKPDFLDVEVKRGPEIPGYFTGITWKIKSSIVLLTQSTVLR